MVQSSLPHFLGLHTSVLLKSLPGTPPKGRCHLPQGPCSRYSPITPLQTQPQEQRLARGPTHHCHGDRANIRRLFFSFFRALKKKLTNFIIFLIISCPQSNLRGAGCCATAGTGCHLLLGSYNMSLDNPGKDQKLGPGAVSLMNHLCCSKGKTRHYWEAHEFLWNGPGAPQPCTHRRHIPSPHPSNISMGQHLIKINILLRGIPHHHFQILWS